MLSYDFCLIRYQLAAARSHYLSSYNFPMLSYTLSNLLSTISTFHMQFIFAPIFIGVFLSTLVTLEGKPSNVIPKLKQVMLQVIPNVMMFTKF